MEMTRTAELLRRVDAGEKLSDVARDLGLSQSGARASLCRRRKEARAPRPLFDAATEDSASLRRQLDAARGEIRRLTEIAHDAAALQRVFREGAEVPVTPPAWLTPEGSPHRGKTPGVLMTIWSDWHLGEVVFADQVAGYNRYDMATAERRIGRLVQRTAKLARLWAGDDLSGVPGAVVALGGDMVSGDIHQELARTNEAEVLEVVLRARDLITNALLKMLDTFPRIFVPCVAGNHGRQDVRSPAKLRTVRNFDWLIYELVARAFSGDDRVSFLIPASNSAAFRVYNHRYLLLHGDDLGVKGGDGIIGALGPILRGRTKVGRQAAAAGRPIDTLLLGHWHQYVATRDTIVNNSLKGFDEFAHLCLRAVAAPPSQAMWFSHPAHGITMSCEVLVDDSGHLEDEKEHWVSWKA